LFNALVRTLANEGIECASVTILGGFFMQLQYCVAPPDPSGRAVIAYTNPIDAGEAFMIFGNDALGKSVSGAPLVHCHATASPVTESTSWCLRRWPVRLFTCRKETRSAAEVAGYSATGQETNDSFR
jgi:hypothetical protein